MFSTALQSSTVSLFSSTGSDPLALFSVHKDDSLPVDSFVVLLHDRLSQPPPPAPAILITPQHSQYQDDNSELYGYCLDQTVLHIQSPTITTTYIQSPPVLNNLPGNSGSSSVDGLGIKHPWIHLQVRNLSKEWAFEVGIVDLSARVGILRLSTFQVHFFSPFKNNVYYDVCLLSCGLWSFYWKFDFITSFCWHHCTQGTGIGTTAT
jgi:hypothetical protein